MSSIRSGTLPDFDDSSSWLDGIVDDGASIATISLDDVLRDSSWEDEADLASGLLAGLPLPDEDASVLEGRAGAGSSLSSTSVAYTLDCPVRSRRMEKLSLLLLAHSQTEGTPTSVTVRDARAAVTTSKGSVIIFSLTTENAEQVVRLETHESAATVAFSPDGRTVAVGHSKGTLRIISVATGAIEHVSKEVVQADRGILQVAFLKSNHSLLVLDSGGSAYEFRLRRAMTGRRREESRCVFSGCNGEVVYMAPVRPLDLLLLVSLTKVLIVSTVRGGSVFCALPARGPPEAPPLVDWTLENLHTLSICVARGDQLVFYRVKIDRLDGRRNQTATVVRTVTIDTKHPLSLVKFHGHGLLTVIDSQESLFAVEVERGTVSVGDSDAEVQLAFATADYKGLAYGGNVSAALRCVADNVAYGSCVRAGGTLYVLGTQSMFELTILDERQQLEAYYERSEFLSAALYLLDLVKGRIPLRDPSFMSHVHLRISECLRALLDDTVYGFNSGRVVELVAHYRRNIDVLLRLAIGTHMYDVLYDEIYPRLEKDVLSRAILLDLLDSYVLDGLLQRPPPTLVSDYLSNLINEGHFSQLQAAVVRIPIDCIDLHKVMTTCRQNGLYDGVIYIMNRALNDYLGPLEEMLDTVSGFASRGDLLSDHEVEQGSKLMLYLHCCLAGAAYPIGQLPEEEQSTVPVQIYRCITSVRGKDGALRGTNANGDNKPASYPYLRLLLQFDAQQFLHVVCTCADAPLFQAEDNRLQRLTELVGTLSLELHSSLVLSEYLQFVANLVATDRILTPAETVNQVIETMLRMPTLTPAEEASVVEVMRYAPCINADRVLALSLKPIRVAICSHIYRMQRRFVDLCNCFMAPPVNTDVLFDVLHRLFESDLTRKERNDVASFVRERAQELSALSPPYTATLLLAHQMEYFLDLHKRFTPDTRVLLRRRNGKMVEEAFRIRREKGERTLTGDEELDDFLFVLSFEYAALEEKNSDEKLTDLLSYWLPLGAKTDACLNAAAAVSALAASVLLMEARGLLEKAFALLSHNLDTAIAESNNDKMLSYTDAILRFARAHPAEASHHSWLLILFQKVVEAARLGESSDMNSRLLYTVQRILESGTERAAEVVESLLQHSAFAEGTLSEHASLVSSILSSCEYEYTILRSLAEAQQSENAEAVQYLMDISASRQDYIVVPECASCGGSITKTSYLYSCGHMQHQECWTTAEKICPLCEREREEDEESKGSTSLDVPPHAMRHDVTCGSRSIRRPANVKALFGRDERVTKRRRNVFELWDQELHLGPAFD